MTATGPFPNRIVRYESARPVESFTANPHNTRIHPTAQQMALRSVLSRIGFVACVIENARTGYLVDGHDRVMQALRADQPTLPCLVVDLDPDEELEVVTGFDALTLMAIYDKEKRDENLAVLRERVDEATQALCDSLAKAPVASDGPLGSAGAWGDPGESRYREQFGVIVRCTDEPEQREVYERLLAEGYPCRVVTT